MSRAPSRAPERTTLEYGDLDADVVELKRRLSTLGYGGFAMDEDFSKATHLAVASYQIDRGLPGNGIVDHETWGVLDRDSTSAGYTPQAASRGVGGASPAAAAPRPLPSVETPAPSGRGRSVWVWGLLLLLAALAASGLKIFESAGAVLKSQSPSDWASLGLAGFVALAALFLIGKGIGLSRTPDPQPVAPRGVGGMPVMNVETDEGLAREIGET